MADLHEATKLCPNNREIRRLLARVEEECKQMQRAQSKQQGAMCAALVAAGGQDSDHEAERDEDEDDQADRSLGRTLDGPHGAPLCARDGSDESPQPDKRPEAWAPSGYSLNRTLAEARPGSPPSEPRRSTHKYPPRDPMAQPGPLMQPTKQAQIVKTNQHMNSLQAGGRPTGRSQSQYAPSSPLPSRHMSSVLKPGPGIDISPLMPPVDEPTSVYTERLSLATPAHHCDSEALSPSQLYGPGSSKAPERLSAHSVSSLDAMASASPAPGGPGLPQELPRDLSGGIGATTTSGSSGSQPGNMRVSSSTSSLASSSSLSDSGKLQGPDVRSKTTSTSSDKTKPVPTGSEYKPRPFMGIMDKTARFQQQQQQQQQHPGHLPLSRGWQSHSSEGLMSHSMAAMGLQAVPCEIPYGKPASAYHHEQLKAPSQGPSTASTSSSSSAAGLHNGMHAGKEFAEKFCQMATCYKESKPAMALPHSYLDSKPKQPGLARDNPAIHVASMKPKRSFIESNV